MKKHFCGNTLEQAEIEEVMVLCTKDYTSFAWIAN
jgi:hypothetical protein